jgi:predicted DNA-binding transcriptional regulator YafY
MEKVEAIDELADTPPDELAFDIANYKKSLFGMFAGKTTKVSIEADRTLVDTVFDLFGEKTKILSDGDNLIRFTADVQISQLFFGWCCSFGDKLRILGPESVKEELKEYTKLIGGQY